MKVSIYKVEKIEQKGLGEVIKLFGRDSKKKKVIAESYGHSPYFYVDEKVPMKFHSKIVNTEKGFKSYAGNKLVKVVTKNSNDVPSVRQIFPIDKCYEDDVLYVDRWSIDSGLKNGADIPSDSFHHLDLKPIDFYVEPRRMHIDIEVMMGEGNKLPDWERANMRITSISILDSYSKTVISFINKPSYGNKYNKKKIFGPRSILYCEEEPYKKVIKSRIKTEVGTEYKWIKIYYKTQTLVHFKDTTWKKAIKKELIEYEMLNGFLDFYKKLSPDFFCGWNLIGFDAPYLINRIKNLRIDYKSMSPLNSVIIGEKSGFSNIITIKGVVMFDTMISYKSLHPHKISGKLNDAADSKLGYGKVSYSGSLDDLYERDESKFLRYNAIDVISEYEIFMKMRMMEFYSGLRRYIGCAYEDMKFNSLIIDFFLLSRAKADKFVLPSARYNKYLASVKDTSGFSGAHVPIPSAHGRTMNVLTIDLKSLYPTIMITWNLGNDTIIEVGVKVDPKYVISTPPINGNVYKFRSDKISFIAKCLKDLIDYRDELREQLYHMKKYKETEGYTDLEIEILDNTQTIVKFITNSIYGVLGMPKYRLYDVRIAECVTTIGRMILMDSINYIEAMA